MRIQEKDQELLDADSGAGSDSQKNAQRLKTKRNFTYRKRRRHRYCFYGYDPAITVLAGDPRLEPPPAWFGVNYHPSQPISNSWEEWGGAETQMFNIATNQTDKISSKCEMMRDSVAKRRRERIASLSRSRSNDLDTVETLSDSDLGIRENVAELGSDNEPHEDLTLHPPQPTPNEWSDWNTIDPWGYPGKQYGNAMRGDTSFSHRLEGDSGNLGADNETYFDVLSDPGIPIKDIPASMRNKVFSKINRMRKLLYEKRLNSHVDYLGKAIHLLKGESTCQEETSQDSDQVWRILLGEGTHWDIRPQNGEYDSTEKNESNKIGGATPQEFDFNAVQDYLRVEIRERMSAQRTGVLLAQSPSDRLKTASVIFGLLKEHVSDLVSMASGSLALKMYVTYTKFEHDSKLSALVESLAKVDSRRKFAEKLGENLSCRELLKTYIKLMALQRVIRCADRLLFTPEIEQTNSRILSILRKPQYHSMLRMVSRFPDDDFDNAVRSRHFS